MLKLTPVRASESDISFSIIRSPPFLLNNSCCVSSTITITSPGSASGI